MRSLGRYFAERQITQPTPTYARPNLWPDVLMETTRGILKSHSNFGVANVAIKPPDAPSSAIVLMSSQNKHEYHLSYRGLERNDQFSPRTHRANPPFLSQVRNAQCMCLNVM